MNEYMRAFFFLAADNGRGRWWVEGAMFIYVHYTYDVVYSRCCAGACFFFLFPFAAVCECENVFDMAILADAIVVMAATHSTDDRRLPTHPHTYAHPFPIYNLWFTTVKYIRPPHHKR